MTDRKIMKFPHCVVQNQHCFHGNFLDFRLKLASQSLRHVIKAKMIGAAKAIASCNYPLNDHFYSRKKIFFLDLPLSDFLAAEEARTLLVLQYFGVCIHL